MVSKVIVITGASGGIGAALARQLGAQGHRVVLAARRKAELERVASEAGPGAIAVVTDVRIRTDVEHLRDVALEAFDQVDVWVNNAGRGIHRRVLDLDDADLDEMMAVNVKSALFGMQAIIPHFRDRGEGHLLNVSSFLGRVPMAPVRSAYSAAKAALNSLTANLRMDLQEEYPRIHVSLVLPGMVATDFAANVLHTSQSFSVGSSPPQSAEEVANVITALIEHPESERYTNPAQREIVGRYFEDVGAFEAGMVSQLAARRP